MMAVMMRHDDARCTDNPVTGYELPHGHGTVDVVLLFERYCYYYCVSKLIN